MVGRQRARKRRWQGPKRAGGKGSNGCQKPKQGTLPRYVEISPWFWRHAEPRRRALRLVGRSKADLVAADRFLSVVFAGSSWVSTRVWAGKGHSGSGWRLFQSLLRLRIAGPNTYAAWCRLGPSVVWVAWGKRAQTGNQYSDESTVTTAVIFEDRHLVYLIPRHNTNYRYS